MARSRLVKTHGEKETYTAQVSRYGFVPNNKGKTTICLQNVRDSHGKLIADHIWTPEGDKFKNAGIFSGDTVQFVGVATQYRKKYGRYDYCLRKISFIEKITDLDPITQMVVDLVYELCGISVSEYIHKHGKQLKRGGLKEKYD